MTKLVVRVQTLPSLTTNKANCLTAPTLPRFSLSELASCCGSTRYRTHLCASFSLDDLTQSQMPPQRNVYDCVIPSARANYDRLCGKHKIFPTPADVDAIKSVIGPVSALDAVKTRFEPALLFFLPRSAVRFNEGSLLVGWKSEFDEQLTCEVWFKPSTTWTPPSLLTHGPYFDSPIGLFGRGVCDRWHPVIFDIVNPNENRDRAVQYEYFKACIKLLQAAVPPPCIESPLSTLIGSAQTSLATLIPNDHHQRVSTSPVLPVPGGRQGSIVVDLTGSDEDVIMDAEETSASAPVNHISPPAIQFEEKIQAFREELDKKGVKELQQMSEKPLPSWIRELAEDVLQKKMLRELELAENFL
jgi:hypothetical protein